MSRIARLSLACLAIAVAVTAVGVFALARPFGPGAGASGAGQVAVATGLSPSETPYETATATPPDPTPTPYPIWSPGPIPSDTPTPGPKSAGRVPQFLTAGAYAFPVRGCPVIYSHYHLYYAAQDIYAAKGCSFVAPTSGVIDEVSYTDTWVRSINAGSNRGGLFVSMRGNDGVRYYGSHLSAIAPGIAPGVHVTAGQLLGKTGDSGQAKGKKPHLHFGISWPTNPGIWWVRRGEVYPWPYLDAWLAGNGKSPAGAVNALHAKLGDEPKCTAAC